MYNFSYLASLRVSGKLICFNLVALKPSHYITWLLRNDFLWRFINLNLRRCE